MATYRITAPDGRKIKLTGDSPPIEAELEQIFSGLSKESPLQTATDQGIAQATAGAEERAGEHGVGGAFLGASKELGRAPLKLIDYVPLIAAARKMGIMPAGFDEAMAKAHESLTPRGSTEKVGATTAKVAKGVGEVAAGVMSGGGLPGLRLARGVAEAAPAIEGAVPVAEAAAPVAKAAMSKTVAKGVEEAATALGRKIGDLAPIPGGRWLGGQVGRLLGQRLVKSGMTKEAAEKAVENVAKRAVAEATKSTLPAELSQEQLGLVGQLRGLAQNNPADKIKIVQAAQQAFPKSWKQVVEYIMAPRTRMGTINVPGPGWTPPPTPSLE